MPGSRLIGLLLIWPMAAISAAAQPEVLGQAGLVTPNPSSLITNAQAVRSFAPAVAGQGLKVQLQGVVTYIFDPHSCFVQDDSAGIYVGNGVEFPPVSAGDIVRLEGVSDPGDYAPIIRPTQVQKLGHTNLPPALRVSYADLMTGREDSQFVEIVGLVRTAVRDPEGHDTLEIDMGGGRVTVFVPAHPPSEKMQLVDSTVRIQGVCGTWFNKLRQLFGVRLMVPSWEEVAVIEPASVDLLTQPAQPIGNLLRFAPKGTYGHRVKVVGTVVLQQPGRALFLQDDLHGLYVQTRQTGMLAPGDRVEVIGFPDKGEYTPVLQDAIWRKIGSGPQPSPVAVNVDAVLSGLQDCRLVTIKGRLLDHTRANRDIALLLEVDDRVFSANLPNTNPNTSLGSLENNSLLRLTGVCRIEIGEDWRAAPDWRAKSFRILLRDAADVQVLSSPPWWTLGRLLWAVGILVAIVLVALLWATSLRFKVKQQTFIIRQQLELEARLKERYRDLFENANDMVYTHDLSGRITSINMVGEQFLGRNRAAIINRYLPEFILEEQRAAVRRWLEDIVDGKAPTTVEWIFLTATGQQLRLETSVRLINHEGGEVEVEGIARDVTERHRLEKEILETSSREQRRIGHDLHDGVCQQLAGIAVLSDILADKLAEQSRPEAGQAHQITKLVEQANKQTRAAARGSFPVRLEENGLISALEELTQSTSTFYQTRCQFICSGPVVLGDHSAAHHLYYIAQEAILNAVKHSKARLIEVSLRALDDQECTLTIQDDGVGLPNSWSKSPGMGIRIMKYRARMIAATIAFQAAPQGGTEVVCHFFRTPNPRKPGIASSQADLSDDPDPISLHS